MSELRYSELKYEGQTYTEQWKIDEILVKNKFNWMVNAEIKNARLEIFNDTLVWNAGIWYAGDWFFGVWRGGEWKSGTWQNGVWYNGTWQNGTFKSGIIYKGIFFKGKIESGEIRGGNFINVEIDPKVVEYTGDEYQTKKETEQQTQTQEVVAQPEQQNPDQVKVHSTKPAAQQQVQIGQPKIQEKKEYNMKKIKTYENFIKKAVNFFTKPVVNRYYYAKLTNTEALLLTSDYYTKEQLGEEYVEYILKCTKSVPEGDTAVFDGYILNTKLKGTHVRFKTHLLKRIMQLLKIANKEQINKFEELNKTNN